MPSFRHTVALLAAYTTCVAAQGTIIFPVNPANNDVFQSGRNRQLTARATATNPASNTTVFIEPDQGSASTTGRYTANIVYGGATYKVQLDTGSSDFVLASTSCTNCLEAQQKYPETGINTGCQANTDYGSGKAYYNVFLDNATLAGASSNGQNVACGAMTQETGTFKTRSASGLLGLAYAQLSEIYNTCPGRYLPVTDQLVKDGVIDDAFGLCFKMDQSGGVFALGCAQVEGLVFTDVVQNTGYYTVQVNSFKYGDNNIALSGNKPILDSGTTLLILPTDMYNQVLSEVCAQLSPLLGNGTPCNADLLNNQALTMTPDIVASFPNITITMSGNAQLVVQPQSYWVDLGQGNYQFGIQSSGGEMFIIGDVALQGHYLFFDKGNFRVGILVAPQCDTSAVQLTGSCSNAVVVQSGNTASSLAPLSLVAMLVMAFTLVLTV